MPTATRANTHARDEAIERAATLLRGRRVAVLTGAGVSTDSGIPDYRGEGAPARTPMTAQQFLASEASRRRYWAGSHLGWRLFRAAEPNSTHSTLADWERAGIVNGLVTQNVDGLHVRAGSRTVVELHGSMDRVRCLVCGQIFARGAIAEQIDSANPGLAAHAAELNPDGDAEVGDLGGFVAPSCTVCRGVLKPEVVFFGEFVPAERFAEASDIVGSADALLIAGTSLAVNSGVRLLEIARRRHLPIVVINRGTTKGDSRASVKIDGGVAEALHDLTAALAPEGAHA